MHRTPFRDLGPEAYAQRPRERDIATVRTKAATLGLPRVASPAYSTDV